MNMSPSLIQHICNHFDEQEVQDMLQAIEVELKQVARKDRKNGDFYLQIASQVYDEDFWQTINYMLCFRFSF